MGSSQVVGLPSTMQESDASLQHGFIEPAVLHTQLRVGKCCLSMQHAVTDRAHVMYVRLREREAAGARARMRFGSSRHTSLARLGCPFFEAIPPHVSTLNVARLEQ